MKLTKRIRHIIVIGGLFAITLFVILIARFFSPTSGATLTIEAPGAIRNGSEHIFIFHYINNNDALLQDVQLEITLPPSSLVHNERHVPIFVHTVGELGSRAKGTFELPITLFGAHGETARIGARLRYQPQNATAFFETEERYDVRFEGSIIEASFKDFSTDASGNIQTTLVLDATSDIFHEVTAHILYPDNFRFVGAQPVARRGTTDEWVLRELHAATPTAISIFGRVIGAGSGVKPLEVKVVRVAEGKEFVLASASSIDQIVSSGLVVFQKINNDRPSVVSWGDVLSVSVAYKNATDSELRNALVEVAFPPSLVDVSRSDFRGAFFDHGNGIVRFDENAHRPLASLASKEEGSLSFSIALVALPPRGMSTTKNFTFSSNAKISARSSDGSIDISGIDALEAKIRTNVVLSGRVLYANQYAHNSGPIPPRVGAKTTYTVIWDISNFSNDIRPVSLETFLGPNVAFEQIISPQNARIRYNIELRQVTWDIGTLEGGAGFVTPIRQAVFQISLTPSQDQVGTRALLIGVSRFAGTDAFASTSIEASVAPIYSDLPDDPSINKQGIIAQ